MVNDPSKIMVPAPITGLTISLSTDTLNSKCTYNGVAQ
jgi:hypothetical protein